MKRFSLVIMAALVLTFTQCKKTDTPSNNEGVYITLTADYGQGGTKTEFIPGEGIESPFVWTDGATEYIYVGGSNHAECLGVLSGTGDGSSSISFTGTITPSANETLYFFYLGKDRDGSAVTTLDFSNQDGTLANVTCYHVAISDGVAYTGQTSFSATLNMKMSIAKFGVGGFVNSNNDNEIVYLHGNDIFATATVNYQEGAIVGATKGFINCGLADDDKYVALIPSTNSQTTLKFDSNSKTGSFTFANGVTEGKYYSKSGAALAVVANDPLEGTTPGLFSVEVETVGTNKITKRMVRFSKGNLQATTTDSWATYTWSFKEHQYDMDADGNVGENYEDRAVVSHFGYGTSGYNEMHPYMTSYDETDYPAIDISGTEYDWGVHNAITNGGNEAGLWRTLKMRTSSDNFGEWRTIFNNTFNGRTGSCYAKAYLFGDTDHGVHGVIVLPDNYIHPEGVPALVGINSGDVGYWNDGNKYSEADWAKLEAAGCVFLPAAGQRDDDYDIWQIGAQDEGLCAYWSGINDEDWSDSAYCLDIKSDDTPGLYSDYNYYGFSVRLVLDVE